MDSVLEILSASVVALFVVYLFARILTTPKNLPPGPFAWPLIGSLHLIGLYPHRALLKLSEQYGPLISVWFGQRLIIAATSPEMAMEFVKTRDANFCSRPTQQVTSILLPHDLTFSNVTPHSKQLRKIFTMQFTTSKKVEAAQQLRADEFKNMLRTIGPQEGWVNVKFHLEVLAGNVFSQLIMGKRLLQPASQDEQVHDSTEKLKDLMTITADLDRILGTFNPGDFIPALKKLDLNGLGGRFTQFRARMDSFIAKILDERLELRRESKYQQSQGTRDYLDALLDEVDQKNNEIDLNVVKTMLWEIYAAGMETNIASSEWAMAEMVNSPEAMKKCQEELDTVVGRDRMVQESDLAQLPYIKAVAKETLRLHPPVPFLAHECIKSCEAFGYSIKAGTSVFVNVWGMGRLESVFPDAEKFNPDRFLPGGSNAGLDYQGQHFELLPFGSGRRICAGMPIASLMVQCAVANLMHAYTWTPAKNLDLMEGLGAASLSKAVPLRAYAKPRLASQIFPY